MLDPRQGQWIALPSMTTRRSSVGLAAVNGLMLCDDGWTFLPEMSVCRRNAGIVVVNDFLFALGGDDGACNLSSMEYLEIDSLEQRWNTLQAEMPQARSYCGVTLLPKS
ncbi:unnamed protein product [Nippostrongylus brasiliensis]|uniref:Kelch repeat protein n=1 Tax=Nippostrongylus brasiliensis TaxID=27835 RepID=A0A0N4Y7K2_NIPBR|nr:unnamed protein product [Nippostrongylus brasiliensis]